MRRTFVVMLFELPIANMMVLNSMVLLPNMIRGKQGEWSRNGVSAEGLSELDTSLIIAIYSLPQLIFASLENRIRKMCGFKSSIVLGSFLMTASTCGLGALVRINDPVYF